MRYIGSRRDVECEFDTATQPIGTLYAYVLILAKIRGGATAFERRNGPNSLRPFAAAVRARYFREHQHLPLRLRYALTEIAPPPCRCGRVGTRRVGLVTFCRDCGPSVATTQRLAKANAIMKAKGTALIEEAHRREDAQDAHRRVNRTAKFGKNRSRP